jgi:hypothetical protein
LTARNVSTATSGTPERRADIRVAKGTTSMKTYASVLAATLLLATQASATTVSHTGLVSVVRTHDSASFPSSSEDWIAVQGLSSAGHTCSTSGGKVVLLVRDDERGKRMMSLATSALLSGKTVSVTIDDTKKRAGTNFCLLQYITLNP